jgi:hypothetical protein
MSYVLFISENKLKDSTAITGNVDVEFLLPYLKVAQKKHIERVLGTDLFEKLQSDISSTSLTGNYQTLVEDYIQDTLVHWSFFECIPFLRYKIMNNNIVQKNAENSTPLSRDEALDLREEVRNTAEFYTERLIDYLRHNNNLFPEYSTSSGADVQPDKTAFYSGINLEKMDERPGKITLDDFLTADISR